MALPQILADDFRRIAAEYDFSALAGRTVFVTGATGLLGSNLILFLDYLNRTRSWDIKIRGLARSQEKVRSVFRDLSAGGWANFVYGDVRTLPPLDCAADYVIHGASLTGSRDFIDRAVETIDIAVNGTLNLLRAAKDMRAQAFVYLSSMEAFGVTDGKGEVREADLGYIDILSPRSSYMESKRMCENLCACFAAEYGVNAKIVRLAQTLGAGIAYADTRVAAQFARAVIEGHDIVLKTEGKTKRPILYIADALSAVLTVLLRGKTGDVYTAAAPATFCTIRETAEMVAQRIAGGAIKVKFDIKGVPAEYAPNLNLNLNLNVDKLAALGWRPAVGLEEAYRKMITAMRGENK